MFIAGGQSLVPMLNFRLAYPSIVIDINHCGMDTVEFADSGTRVGATVRHREFEYNQELAKTIPLMGQSVKYVGYPAVRNRGTLAGSLCNADPTAEFSLVAVALDAELELQSMDGTARVVSAPDFFVGPYLTARGDDELVTSVWYPKGAAQQSWFGEVVERTGDFALAAVAATFQVQGDRISDMSLAASGLVGSPVRLTAIERVADADGLHRHNASSVIDNALTELAPDAETAYQRNLVKSLILEMVDKNLN